MFSESALSLLNTFLDSLLYNFLAKARGTSLSQLRPAITEVLKAKLARDALASADEELHGLIGETGDDMDSDDDSTDLNGQWSQDWHLEMAFKRMRLRVMVFIRLGDFDDEDEDRFLEEEDEFRHNGEKPAQDMNFLGSPAAVYLASILEHVAEQALSTAGESAYRRSVSRMNRRSSVPNSKELEGMDLERVIVQEMDVEKIALNPTLGRLWRTWRKNYRNAFGVGGTFSPPASPAIHRPRLGSLNEIAFPPNRPDDDARKALEQERRLTPDEIPEGDVTETDIAANIPLPMSENDVDEIEIMGVAIPLPMSENDVDEIEIMGVAIPLPMTDNDVNEIEVPGLARAINGEEQQDETGITTTEIRKRRNSAGLPFSSPLSNENTRPPLTRLRSNSSPAPGRLPFFYYFFSPKAEANDDEESTPANASKTIQDIGNDKLSRPDTKEIVPEPIFISTKESELIKGPIAPQEKVIVAPIDGVKAVDVGAKAASITPEEKKIPGVEEKVPVLAEQVKAPAAVLEDPVRATGGGKTGHKKEAGVIAGAAVLAGAAYATIAGSRSKTEEIEEQHMAKSSAPKAVTRKNLPDITDRIKLAHRLSAKDLDQLGKDAPATTEQPMPVSPATSTGAPSGPVSAIDEPEKAETVFSKRSSSYVPTGPMPRSNPDEYPEVVKSEKFVQPKPEYADSVSSTGSGYDLGTVPASALAAGDGSEDTRYKLKSVVPPPAVASHGDEQKQYSSSQDHDVEEIGVARTTNERVQSISSSPRSTTPDQQRSYYLPGSPKAGPPASRPDSSSRERSLVGADDYILARQTSASKRNTGPSPLRSVTEAESQPKRNGISARDTPHAVPFYHRSSNDETLKQEQLNRRNTKDSLLSETDLAGKAKSRPPPLNTAFVPMTEAARPSTAQSAGRRSTSSTPPSAHSAKGSASSSFKRPSDESRRKDFDSLLKEGETVKYTLTPDGLRESDVSHSSSTPLTCDSSLPLLILQQPFRPSSSNLNRASALALSTAAIDRGPPSPRIISSSNGRRPSAHDIASAATSPRPDVTKVTVISQPTIQSPQKKGYIPRVSEFRKSFTPRSLTSRPEPLNTNTRKSGFLPREPRVMTDDTRDFADFMRSTKPTTEPTLVPLVRAPSDSSLINKAKAQAAQPNRPFSRQKLVPREPDVKGGGSDDLIDFIREGPPSAHGLGEHRIPRTVAPFRSTADSADLKELGSFIHSGTTSTSITSKNSRLSLGANTVNSNSSLLQNGRAAPSSSGSAMPPIVRKSRRVKDPYAIDSDDEDDYLTSLPSARSHQQEESLADFLKNSEPPKANAPAPVVSMGNRQKLNGSRSNAPSVGGPVRSSSIANSMATSRMSKMKPEARAAGATKSGFGGNGFHYSTNDMADFLRSSGPVEAYAVSPEVPLTKKPSKRGKPSFWKRLSLQA
jgi:hypothetical protein